jgi:hypothetical protein
MRHFMPLLSLCALVACEGDADLAELPLECETVTEIGIVHDDLSRAGLLDSLGAPDTVEWSVMQTSGSEDSLFVVRYPGLAVSLHKPSGGTEVVDQVRVTDNQHLRYPEVGIGVAAQEVKRLLADHTPVEADDQLIYTCHVQAANDNPVAFRLLADTVIEIIYTYYMD